MQVGVAEAICQASLNGKSIGFQNLWFKTPGTRTVQPKIDAEDFAIVKIVGHPAKKPSFWINRADFVRQYRRIDGFWLPYRDETHVEVKMYGRRVFTVDHQRYVINPANHLQAELGDKGDPD